MSHDLPHDLIGKQLGRYHVLRELGRGGMGTVFLAEDAQLGRQVALKVLAPDASTDPGFRVRFAREARAAAAITHSGITTVFDVGEAGGVHFIAMEYVAGESLRSFLNRRGPVPIDRALAIASELFSALAKAHAAGVVHRDLKPENIMIAVDGSVKVLDFGIAQIKASPMRPTRERGIGAQDDGENRLTEEGHVVGTYGYMSPEQCLGLGVDARSDVFACGVLLYELLAAALPFAGDSSLARAQAVVSQPPRPLVIPPSAVAPQVQALLARCLAKDPDSRFRDAGELRDALSACLVSRSRGAPLETRPARVLSRAPARNRMGSTRARFIVVVGVLGVATIATIVATSQGAESSDRLASASGGGTADGVAGEQSALRARELGKTLPLGMGDIPVPVGRPEAMAAYRNAMLAQRDASWATARAELEKALAADPDYAAASVALVRMYGNSDPARARQMFQMATLARARLSERDVMLLDILEPIIVRPQADFVEVATRARAALLTRPLDAEFWELLGVVESYLGRNTEASQAFERATTIDSKFADAWQNLGIAELAQGHLEDAKRALARCVDSSAIAVDCLQDSMLAHAWVGECQAYLDDARIAVMRAPTGGWAHRFLAAGLFATGAPIEAVTNAVMQAEKQEPESSRERSSHRDAALLAIARGELDVALEEASKLWAIVRASEDGGAWSKPALLLVGVARELGDRTTAAEVARTFVRNRAALQSAPNMDPLADATLAMERVLLEAGERTSAEFEAARQAWIDSARARIPNAAVLWTIAWADVAWTPAEATAALAVRPKDFVISSSYRSSTRLGRVGASQVERMAGRADQGLRLLSEASRDCQRFFFPFDHARARIALGAGLEAAGDREAACRVYRELAAQWQSARPRSTTFELARDRIGALGCDGPH